MARLQVEPVSISALDNPMFPVVIHLKFGLLLAIKLIILNPENSCLTVYNMLKNLLE